MKTVFDQDQLHFKKAAKKEAILCKQLAQPNVPSYSELFQKVMSTITDGTVAQAAMLDVCRQYFASCKPRLVAVNEFARTYQWMHAAYWYTKDSFIYRIMNTVLRTGSMETCHLLRFYITHLSEQIHQLKHQQQTNATDADKKTVLYRGLRQSEADLKILEKLVGQVILTKGFVSTSRDRRIAFCYAGASHPQSLESQPLLIEIDVDMTAPDIIAADISHLSHFPEEQEVLFDIGAQFRVESLKYSSFDESWACKLVAMPTEAQPSQILGQFMSDEPYPDLGMYSKDEARLEKIMFQEREQKFKIIYNDQESDFLWRQSPSISWIALTAADRACIIQQKALINWQRNSDFHQFYIECKHAWEVFVQGNYDTIIQTSDTAVILNNYGLACQRLKITDHAIDLLQQATEIRNRVGSPEHFRAQSLRNLALAYTDKGDYKNAFAALNQALILGQQFGPTRQWSTSLTLRNMAYFLHARGDYSQATVFLVKALKTFEECANLCIKGDNI